jgi:hypothetical protein
VPGYFRIRAGSSTTPRIPFSDHFESKSTVSGEMRRTKFGEDGALTQLHRTAPLHRATASPSSRMREVRITRMVRGRSARLGESKREITHVHAYAYAHTRGSSSPRSRSHCCRRTRRELRLIQHACSALMLFSDDRLCSVDQRGGHTQTVGTERVFIGSNSSVSKSCGRVPQPTFRMEFSL